jgi:hypothetical protein
MTLDTAIRAYEEALSTYITYDPYRYAASKYFVVEYDAVTPPQRDAMKKMLFAHIYGRDSASIRAQLSVARERVVDGAELQTLLVCSVRYALGRMSYMPGLIQEIARRYSSVLFPSTLLQFADDIDSADKVGRLGDPKIDAPGWRTFAKWCRDEAARAEMKLRAGRRSSDVDRDS